MIHKVYINMACKVYRTEELYVGKQIFENVLYIEQILITEVHYFKWMNEWLLKYYYL